MFKMLSSILTHVNLVTAARNGSVDVGVPLPKFLWIMAMRINVKYRNPYKIITMNN